MGRICRRDENHPVEAAGDPRLPGNPQMGIMDRVEGSTHQADSHVIRILFLMISISNASEAL